MSRPDSLATQRTRVRIAQATARLIAEHGLTDWAAAKRKACRELGLPERATLPANDARSRFRFARSVKQP